MTYYHRPTKLTQVFNSLISFFASLGLTPSDTVTLEAKGRRSGNVHANAVTWVEHEDTRYLVSPRGESEWVRNVRAAGGSAVIRHRGRRQVQLQEIEEAKRAPILKLYLQKTASATKAHFDVDKDDDVEAFAAIAGKYPVFLISDTA